MHYCLIGNIILNAYNEVAGGLTFTTPTYVKIPCEMNENTLLCRMQNSYTSEIHWALIL
jgi:hypothetical protein